MHAIELKSQLAEQVRIVKELEKALREIRALDIRRMGGDHWSKGEEGLDPDAVFDIIDKVLTR